MATTTKWTPKSINALLLKAPVAKTTPLKIGASRAGRAPNARGTAANEASGYGKR